MNFSSQHSRDKGRVGGRAHFRAWQVGAAPGRIPSGEAVLTQRGGGKETQTTGNVQRLTGDVYFFFSLTYFFFLFSFFFFLT